MICNKVYEYKRHNHVNVDADLRILNELGANGWRISVYLGRGDYILERESIK